ncbi:hypothetical protein C8R47DRAFT_1071400 [Mycena vitilis]|nr:hypothetical protein C8R47DRAFT_1071400 [Mycena vitilis]
MSEFLSTSSPQLSTPGANIIASGVTDANRAARRRASSKYRNSEAMHPRSHYVVQQLRNGKRKGAAEDGCVQKPVRRATNRSAAPRLPPDTTSKSPRRSQCFPRTADNSLLLRPRRGSVGFEVGIGGAVGFGVGIGGAGGLEWMRNAWWCCKASNQTTG